MIKAVNMEGYKFNKGAAIVHYVGYGIIDTDTNKFYSADGKKPYVLARKKYIQSCIDGGWVKPYNMIELK